MIYQTGAYSPEGHAQALAHASAFDMLVNMHPSPVAQNNAPMTTEALLAINAVANRDK